MATSMTDYSNSTISQIVINNTTYDITDASTRSIVSNLDSRLGTLENTVSNKVSKTGDTITGDIVNTGDGRVYNIKGINTNLALANNGVSATVYPGYQVLDGQGRISTRLESVTKTNGENGWNLYARNYNTSGTSTGQKGISCTLNKAGTATWSVSDAANFRSAIGAGTGNVTGVKGNAESTYRTGNVNLTPANIGALSLSGNGTITNGQLNLKTTAVDNTTKPSSIQYFWGLTCVDTSNRSTGGFGGSRDSTGTNTITLSANNNSSTGTAHYNSLSVKVDMDGNRTYGVTNPTAFRSAIGAAASSDRRLKHDIKPLEQDAIDFVSKLQPCVYTINNEKQVGLIAQDVHAADTWGTRMAFETVEGLDGLDDWEIMPDGSPTWKLDYIRIIPPLVATVQQQSKKIEELESKIKLLEKK